MNVAFYNDVDAEVLAVWHPPSDVEIVAQLFETKDVSNDTSFCKLSTPCKSSPFFKR